MNDRTDRGRTASGSEARTEQMMRAWHRALSAEAPSVPMLADEVDRIPDRYPFRKSIFGFAPSRRTQLILVVALLLSALLAAAIVAGVGRPYRPMIVDNHWDVLSIGDAFADSRGWPGVVAESMAADLGIEVTAASLTCLGDCGNTAGPLDRIRASGLIQDDIRKADVILVQPQPGWVVTPTLRTYFAGECGGDDNRDCLRGAIADYRTYTGELLDELYALSGRGTVIRVIPTDAYVIRHWNPSGAFGGDIDPAFELNDADPAAFTVVIDWFKGLMEAGMDAAAARCIPVWDANAYFSGADYRHAPSPSYFDGFALNAVGERIVADRVLGLGYRARLEGCSPAD